MKSTVIAVPDHGGTHEAHSQRVLEELAFMPTGRSIWALQQVHLSCLC